MASIEERKRADGTIAYKVEVVLRVDGERIKKSKTFDRRVTALAWAKKTEADIRERGAAALAKPLRSPSVGDAVRMYLERDRAGMGSTKRQVLRFIGNDRADISKIRLADLHAADIRTFGEHLASGDRGAATVSSYLTHLCHVLATAEDDVGPAYHVNLDALLRGKASARRAGIAGKPNVRERRPSLEEIDRLMEYFMRRAEGDTGAVPMHLIVPFALFGLRRQSEIVKLRWADIDGDEAIVRGMKDPRRPRGRDRTTTLTEEAQRIIAIHGHRDPVRVWPYSGDVVSRLFTQSCRVLEIEDLRFHDLRHEGVSWLRERGWSTSHVMMVSGHSATATLDRYSQMRERGDKFDQWKWWPILAALDRPAA